MALAETIRHVFSCRFYICQFRIACIRFHDINIRLIYNTLLQPPIRRAQKCKFRERRYLQYKILFLTRSLLTSILMIRRALCNASPNKLSNQFEYFKRVLIRGVPNLASE